MAKNHGSLPLHEYPGPVPEIPLISQLQDCTTNLSTTLDVVENYLMRMVDRMVKKSKGTEPEEDFDEFGETRKLMDTLRQSRDISFKTMTNMKAYTSVIDNFTTGKAVQKLYSVPGQSINGRNRAYGQESFQGGGIVTEATAIQFSKDMAHISGNWHKDSETPSLATITPSPAELTIVHADTSEDNGRLDSGLEHPPESTDDNVSSTAGANKGRTRSSKKK